MTAVHIKAANRSGPQAQRRIVFVPPRSVAKLDTDGFTLPENYFVEPDDVKNLVGWKQVSHRGLGLRNCGNTCYMNSVLQALTHSSALANDAILGNHMSSCTRKKSNIFCGYCALLTHIKNAMTTKGRSEISPEPILRNLKLLAKTMRYGRQEDSHEFLRQLIDSCVAGELPIKMTSNPKGPIVPPLVRSTTFVGQLMSGYLQSQITCSSCGNVSRTFDPYMDISLEIQDSHSVIDCLRKFTHADTLAGQNAYKCSKCQKRVTAKKQMLIHRSPPLLTVQLKRFNIFTSRHSAQKINKSIQFGDRLDMAPFMSDRRQGPLNYSLFAIIVHEGSSMGSGHYVCYAKAANGLWYLFNDSYVQQVSEKTVFSQSAYILMYESSDARCFYPSLGHSLAESEPETPTTPTRSMEPIVRVTTPTCPDIPTTSCVRVINHEQSEDEDMSCSDESSSDKEVDQETPTAVTLKRKYSAQSIFVREAMNTAVVGKSTRKALRMLTVMKLISRKQRVKSVPTPVVAEPAAQPVVPTHSWGKIPVASWDDTRTAIATPEFHSAVSKMTALAEPGARSQHDTEYDLGKNMHNPRSEFASGNGLPPTLSASFNALARGDMFRRQPAMGRGKGKGGKGGRFGKGKGKGGKGSFRRR